MSKKTSHKDEGKTLVKYHTGSANLGVNDLHKSYRILLKKINRIIPHSRQYRALLPGQQLSLIFSCSIARFACERRRISGRRLSSSLLFFVVVVVVVCFVVFLSLLFATQPEIHLPSGYSAVCEHDFHI